mmetsp:Transcript_48404/g.149605  ORF Transcript_48404/g.149605 Transcript_48404/m.149605 type:complete len:334 (+) Transcript_48404:1715-2716(+)
MRTRSRLAKAYRMRKQRRGLSDASIAATDLSATGAPVGPSPQNVGSQRNARRSCVSTSRKTSWPAAARTAGSGLLGPGRQVQTVWLLSVKRMWLPSKSPKTRPSPSHTTSIAVPWNMRAIDSMTSGKSVSPSAAGRRAAGRTRPGGWSGLGLCSRRTAPRSGSNMVSLTDPPLPSSYSPWQGMTSNHRMFTTMVRDRTGRLRMLCVWLSKQSASRMSPSNSRRAALSSPSCEAWSLRLTASGTPTVPNSRDTSWSRKGASAPNCESMLEPRGLRTAARPTELSVLPEGLANIDRKRGSASTERRICESIARWLHGTMTQTNAAFATVSASCAW